jgi:hypothetical protein
MREDAMSNEPNPNDVRNLWQGQEVEKVTITVDEIRRRAARFERRIYWRNMREYVAGAVVVALFTVQILHQHGWRMAPGLLLIAGTIYVMFEVSRRGARPVPSDVGMSAFLEFHRQELERQRDALHTVWRWYLLPFVPGFVAALVVAGFDRGLNGRVLTSGAIIILVLVIVWAGNEYVARKLDRKIREVKSMEANNE